MTERLFDVETKLLNLLRLAESEAKGTEHEAKVAMEMAIRLSAKHGIKLSTLQTKKNESLTNWFRGGGSTAPDQEVKEYVEPELREVKHWCDLAERHGWQRHRRTRDPKEGMIYAYRMGVNPKMELRIFLRPWNDVEFEIITNPDPILGAYESWMENIFDVLAVGVTYEDFRMCLGGLRTKALRLGFSI